MPTAASTLRAVDGELGVADEVALHLLAPVATLAALAGALLTPLGPSESIETGLWLLAFTIALPAGLVCARRQTGALRSAPPGAAAWAVALGVLALTLAMAALERVGAGTLHHAATALAGLAALLIPFGLARESAPRRALLALRAFAWPVAIVALPALAGLFVPQALAPARVVLALLVAAAVLCVAMLGLQAPQLPAWLRHLLDVAAIAVVGLLIATTTDVAAGGGVVLHHHGFYLGPVNDVLHGRAMLVDTFSQYGVGDIYALALAFKLVPFGYGGMSLVIMTVTIAAYALLYATLRAAIDSRVLVACGIGVAILAAIFMPVGDYLQYPSTGPLRFGLPCVLIACAVFGARFERWSRGLRTAGLLTLAVAAVWSFETFVYTAAVYTGLAALEAFGARSDADPRTSVRSFAGTALVGLAVSCAAIAALSLVTLAFAGRLPDWGGYLDYIALYSSRGFGQLPIEWFSAGPLAGLAIFLSAAGIVWIARRDLIPPPRLVALAGFTALGVGSYTYYLGRSDPNNVLHLMVPIVALGTLWASVLLRPDGARSATIAGLAVLATGASVALSALPSARQAWPSTALAQILSHPGTPPHVGLRSSTRSTWEQPLIDRRSERAVQALDRVAPGHRPLLVLTEPELTTEILVRAGRRNLLPIAHPPEDSLVSSDDRLRGAVMRVRPGTLMLTSAPPRPGARTALGLPRRFTRLQQLALRRLRARFAWNTVARTRDGLRVVRLVDR